MTTRDQVSGWLYSEEALVRGRLVLAFVDEICVGAGRIEHHRTDLEAAGLGDGYLGFAFPITVAPNDVGRVKVKLEGSDLVLLQRGARVVWPEAESAEPLTKETANALVASYKWMLSRGWLKQWDYDCLKTLLQFGLYEKTLVTTSASGEAQLADPRTAAMDLLSLFYQTGVDLTEHAVASASAFASLADELRDRPGRSAFALWSSERGAMNVIEGSHLGGLDPDAQGAAVRFPLDPERLVVVDSHCRIDFGDAFPPSGLRVFVTV